MSDLKVIFTEESSAFADYLQKIAASNDVSTQSIASVKDFERIMSSYTGKELIVFMNKPSDADREMEKKLDDRLQKILIMLGIPSHIKGSKFLKDAIKTAVAMPESINNITKVLYPYIAEKNNTSASKVERAIRHAIDVSWSRGKIENINTLFGLKVFAKGEKPTNGELIALIADRLIIEFSA